MRKEAIIIRAIRLRKSNRRAGVIEIQPRSSRALGVVQIQIRDQDGQCTRCTGLSKMKKFATRKLVIQVKHSKIVIKKSRLLLL